MSTLLEQPVAHVPDSCRSVVRALQHECWMCKGATHNNACVLRDPQAVLCCKAIRSAPDQHLIFRLGASAAVVTCVFACTSSSDCTNGIVS